MSLGWVVPAATIALDYSGVKMALVAAADVVKEQAPVFKPSVRSAAVPTSTVSISQCLSSSGLTLGCLAAAAAALKKQSGAS